MVSHFDCPTFQVTVLQPLCALVGFAVALGLSCWKAPPAAWKYATVEGAGCTNPDCQIKIELAMTQQAKRRDLIALLSFSSQSFWCSQDYKIRVCHDGAGEAVAISLAPEPCSVAIPSDGCPLVLQRRVNSWLWTWVAPSSVPTRWRCLMMGGRAASWTASVTPHPRRSHKGMELSSLITLLTACQTSWRPKTWSIRSYLLALRFLFHANRPNWKR